MGGEERERREGKRGRDGSEGYGRPIAPIIKRSC